MGVEKLPLENPRAIAPGADQDAILKAVGDEIREKGFIVAKADKLFNDHKDQTSLAAYYQFVYKPIQGLHIITKYDFFDRNYNLLDGDLARITFGIEFYLLNMLELDLQFRQYETNNINFSNFLGKY